MSKIVVQTQSQENRDRRKKMILDRIAKKRAERKAETEKLILMAELQKARRMIKAAQYAFEAPRRELSNTSSAQYICSASKVLYPA